jgi:ATP-binding cassette subfamily A (ABC1) protein 3
MAKTTVWDKFLLLSWKNWLIQFRHPIQTAFEVLIPVCVCAFLILIRSLVEVSEELKPLSWNPVDINSEFNGSDLIITNRMIAYSPQGPVLDAMMQNVVNELNGIVEVPARGFTPVGFPDALALEGNAITLNPFVSVEFDQALSGQTALPNDIHYAMRFPAELRTDNPLLESMSGFTHNWATNIRFGLDFLPGPRNQLDDDGGEPPGYIRVSVNARSKAGVSEKFDFFIQNSSRLLALA